MLEIRNLQVKLEDEDKQILKGVDLTVEAGRVHAIMGPNGSGKSTLSYVLSGRDGYEVTAGAATLDGHDLLAMEYATIMPDAIIVGTPAWAYGDRSWAGLALGLLSGFAPVQAQTALDALLQTAWDLNGAVQGLLDTVTPLFCQHLCEAGLGSISEVFDGSPPYSPGGCTAQAWSVAECQRMLKNLQRAAPELYSQWEQRVAHCLANPSSGDTTGVCRATMILETATPGSEE